jgi:hypothetical protein
MSRTAQRRGASLYHNCDLLLQAAKLRWVGSFLLTGLMATRSGYAVDPAAELWMHGRWPGQDIVTAHLPGGDPIHAATVPCAGCHGASANGQREAGVEAPPLAGTVLRLPRQTGASYRPAYDFAAFVRAVRHGVGAGQTVLAPVMPQYDLTDAQLAALWQFLRDGAAVPPPGFGETEVRVGVVLPNGLGRGSPPGGRDLFAQQVLQQVTAVLSKSAAVHGRQVRLVALGPAELADLAHFQRSDRAVCAVLAPGSAVAPAALSALVGSGALILAPEPAAEISDHPAVLRLTPSLARQRSAGSAAASPTTWFPSKGDKSRCAHSDGLLTVPAWREEPAPAVSSQLPAELGRVHGRIAATLALQLLRELGRSPLHLANWQHLARSGRTWDTGLSARVSWGPRTHSGWPGVWLVSACRRLRPQLWLTETQPLPPKR